MVKSNAIQIRVSKCVLIVSFLLLLSCGNEPSKVVVGNSKPGLDTDSVELNNCVHIDTNIAGKHIKVTVVGDRYYYAVDTFHASAEVWPEYQYGWNALRVFNGSQFTMSNIATVDSFFVIAVLGSAETFSGIIIKVVLFTFENGRIAFFVPDKNGLRKSDTLESFSGNYFMIDCTNKKIIYGYWERLADFREDGDDAEFSLKCLDIGTFANKNTHKLHFNSGKYFYVFDIYDSAYNMKINMNIINHKWK